ncbi:hypothetical protein L6452_28399 [Arctium lappa]|uniref:Uncharacterized protein n=1 Tax=Arctium lappa TaxID=4217 RepID=A0ACB8ZY54_ARCLA|nr:hypothetical protein L6452_28399 [Arctium lappa]
MEIMADQIKKQNIKSTPKTHFFKLNNIFSIFIFIFLISFSISICSYTHHFPNFTDSNDRHYIFVICNGILFFLFMNFDSTHGSSLKQNQHVMTDEIDHRPVLVSSPMEPVAAMDEQKKEIEEEGNDDGIERNGNQVYVNEYRNTVSIIEDHRMEEQKIEIEEEEEEEEEEEDNDDDGMERNGNRVYVNEDRNAVSIIEDRIEDQMAEQQVGVVEEQETGESKDAAETEELNKRCAEFIRNMRERMKLESSCRHGRFASTKINATISF